jgi:hypothetical protein
LVNSGAYLLVYKIKGDINTNYYNLMNMLLNNIYSENSKIEYFKEEPVRTPYGRGYIEDITQYENVKHIRVKFRQGYASLK